MNADLQSLNADLENANSRVSSAAFDPAGGELTGDSDFERLQQSHATLGGGGDPGLSFSLPLSEVGSCDVHGGCDSVAAAVAPTSPLEPLPFHETLPTCDAPEAELYIDDAVRLHGLKAAKLNSALGTVVSYDACAGRYGVLLVSGERKAIKKENLQKYCPHADDRCPLCKNYINLFSFPPCSCKLNLTSTSSTEQAQTRT